jgi:hypothetical protein
MELKDFISTTLAAIVDGVVEAQEKVQSKGAHINPGGLMRTTKAISENAIWDNTSNNFARTVQFDVALTVEDGSKTNAKVGVVAGVFNLGAGGESANKQLAVNRVQFSVPVLFPVSSLPKAARQVRR